MKFVVLDLPCTRTSVTFIDLFSSLRYLLPCFLLVNLAIEVLSKSAVFYLQEARTHIFAIVLLPSFQSLLRVQ
jgi:hypothetical protein